MDKERQSNDLSLKFFDNKAVYAAYVGPSDVSDWKRDGPTNQRTDGQTDGRTHALIELLCRD